MEYFSKHDSSLLVSSPISDKKEPAGKCTKIKNLGETSTEVENSSPQKTSASKNCGKSLSSCWLMKSEPESRLEKGVDVKVRPYVCLQSIQAVFF